MGNEKSYNINLKHSELRELQKALLYHIDNVLIPYYDEISKHQDYIPTQDVHKIIVRLQGILGKLNMEAGEYSETE